MEKTPLITDGSENANGAVGGVTEFTEFSAADMTVNVAGSVFSEVAEKADYSLYIK